MTYHDAPFFEFIPEESMDTEELHSMTMVNWGEFRYRKNLGGIPWISTKFIGMASNEFGWRTSWE